jgi:hypothetical protein
MDGRYANSTKTCTRGHSMSHASEPAKDRQTTPAPVSSVRQGASAGIAIKRPHAVTVISWLFIAAGVVGLIYHAREFSAFQYDVLWVCLVRLLAIVCGVFMLRGSNWARWGLLAWIAYHVILSGFHSLSQLLVHGLLFAVIAWLLLRPQASAYFRGTRVAPNAGIDETP